MSETNINRRAALQVLAAGATLGCVVRAKGQKLEKPVSIGPVSQLTEEWTSIPFFVQGKKALLVRIPAPHAPSPRVLEVHGEPSVFLTAYLLACTHQGCNTSFMASSKVLGCACHGSTFEASDGSVKKGPAASPLRGITLEVHGDEVVAVGLI